MQRKITTILVDDELNNINFLRDLLLQNCPQLDIVATAENAFKAVELINDLQPHLVFMDINMPGMTGFELLRKLEPLPFETIFVTAYNQYAQEAFDYNALAYITKPIVTEKLIAAVEKSILKIADKENAKNIFTILEKVQLKQTPDKIPLPTLNGLLFVKLRDICYCESSGNYTHFFLSNNSKILVSRQLGEYEKLLPTEYFVRIHDKHIINLSCIKEYIKGSGGEVKMEDDTILAVASRRKDEFLSRFDKWLKRK